MDRDDIIRRIRGIRTRENIELKSSPYLRSSFINEYGEEHPVSIRNYQKQGIMNLLTIEQMLLCDDTGLGKTLTILSTLGYIWLKEPNYVPIVIVTKSALHQWGAETNRFMKDIEAITVEGEPFERHTIYEEFFWKHDHNKKRLLILTYDNVMRDMDKAIIRDKSQKPPAQVKKDLTNARSAAKSVKIRFDEEKNQLDNYFGNRELSIHQHVQDMIVVVDGQGPNALLPKPNGWSREDEIKLQQYITIRENMKAAEHLVDKLNNEANPPKEVPGILDYAADMKHDNPNVKFMLVMDEMHKLKNHKSQFHTKVQALSLLCSRLVGMTATPVQNRLMEFWSLFRIIKPELFPKITHFMNQFCITKMQRISGGRQIPIVVGYKNLDEFIKLIEPYYLSRKKYDVAKELPELISQEIECELTDMQEELYDMAEVGLVNKMDDADATGGDMLAALTMIQQAVDAPQLIADSEGNPFEGPSSKIDATLDLLENDAFGRKIIIFSKYEKMISLVENAIKDVKRIDEEGRPRKGYKYVRITGKENDPRIREKNKLLFQDKDSGVNIVLITTAGSESINLHAAEYFLFLDLPWSFGMYLQLTGRMIRIGSLHKAVVACHFLAKRKNGKNTVDHHVLKALRGKKKLADKVAGESLKGGLQFTDSDVSRDVMSMIRQYQDDKSRDKKKATKPIVPTKAASKPRDPEISIVELDLSDLGM